MNELGLTEHVFAASVTLDPLASAPVRTGYLDGTRTLCVIQPTAGVYLPAFICAGLADQWRPPGSVVPVVLRVRLTDTEAAEHFSAGHRFALWSDAFVGRTVRGDELVGYGVICAQESPAPSSSAVAVPA